MNNLSDKLKALGVKVGVSNLQRLQPPADHLIGEIINSSYRDTPLGRVLIVDTFFEPDYRQGKYSLSISSPLNTISEWIKDSRLSEIPVEALGFLDTETTGLSGGTGTYAFLVGAGKFEGNRFHLIQLFMTNPSEEQALLYTLEEFFAPCRATVTFNGKSFDLPLLRSRFAMNGLEDPFKNYIHIDLLHMARRIWRDLLPSKSLGNLEVKILAAQRTEEDVPGWLIPQLYFNFLHDGDATPLKKVFYHNSMDVISMAALLNYISCLVSDILKNPGILPEEQLAVARLYYELGRKETAIQIYQNFLMSNPAKTSNESEQIRSETYYLLAKIYKDLGDLETAQIFWNEAALLNNPYACIELAKYNEHILKKIPGALRWTQAAILACEQNIPDIDKSDNLRAELDHRKKRLERKLQAYSEGVG